MKAYLIKMRVYVIAIIVAIGLISVAMAAVSGHIQVNADRSDVTHINTASIPFSSDSIMGNVSVSFAGLVQQIVATAFLAIGSVVVLRKNK
jgi:hypothetical protein